jgi:hypothetical protein
VLAQRREVKPLRPPELVRGVHAGGGRRDGCSCRGNQGRGSEQGGERFPDHWDFSESLKMHGQSNINLDCF